MVEGGFIKIYRAIRKHWIFQRADYYLAWSILLMEAAYKEDKKIVGSTLVNLKRGQLIGSVRYLKKAFGWKSNDKVSRFVALLESDGMIRTENGQGITVITVCNYDTYNTPEKLKRTATGQKQDDNGTLTGQKQDETKKYKKEEEREEARARMFGKGYGLVEDEMEDVYSIVSGLYGVSWDQLEDMRQKWSMDREKKGWDNWEDSEKAKFDLKSYVKNWVENDRKKQPKIKRIQIARNR